MFGEVPLLGEEGRIDLQGDLLPLGIDFLVYQKAQRVAPHTYYQGYCRFGLGASLKYVKTLFGGGGHWECCKGSPLQSKIYVMRKEGCVSGPWSFGLFVNR